MEGVQTHRQEGDLIGFFYLLNIREVKGEAISVTGCGGP
jgi:hypothetical protein